MSNLFLVPSLSVGSVYNFDYKGEKDSGYRRREIRIDSVDDNGFAGEDLDDRETYKRFLFERVKNNHYHKINENEVNDAVIYSVEDAKAHIFQNTKLNIDNETLRSLLEQELGKTVSYDEVCEKFIVEIEKEDEVLKDSVEVEVRSNDNVLIKFSSKSGCEVVLELRKDKPLLLNNKEVKDGLEELIYALEDLIY